MATFLETSADGASSRTLRVGSASWAMNSAICLCLIEEYNGQSNRKCVSSSRMPGQKAQSLLTMIVDEASCRSLILLGDGLRCTVLGDEVFHSVLI